MAILVKIRLLQYAVKRQLRKHAKNTQQKANKTMKNSKTRVFVGDPREGRSAKESTNGEILGNTTQRQQNGSVRGARRSGKGWVMLCSVKNTCFENTLERKARAPFQPSFTLIVGRLQSIIYPTLRDKCIESSPMMIQCDTVS